MTAHINISNVWKEPTNIYVNVSNVWKEVTSTHVNVSNVWKETYASSLYTIGSYYEGGYYAGESGGYHIFAPHPYYCSTAFYPWQNVQNYCDAMSYNGYYDWTCPNIWELYLIASAKEAIYASFLPGYTYSYDNYWSSSYLNGNYYYLQMSPIGLYTDTTGTTSMGAIPIRRIAV